MDLYKGTIFIRGYRTTSLLSSILVCLRYFRVGQQDGKYTYFFIVYQKGELSKHASKYMTNIFQNKLPNQKLLMQLSFYIETPLI